MRPNSERDYDFSSQNIRKMLGCGLRIVSSDRTRLAHSEEEKNPTDRVIKTASIILHGHARGGCVYVRLVSWGSLPG
jgi:hypothetical protein